MSYCRYIVTLGFSIQENSGLCVNLKYLFNQKYDLTTQVCYKHSSLWMEAEQSVFIVN